MRQRHCDILAEMRATYPEIDADLYLCPPWPREGACASTPAFNPHLDMLLKRCTHITHTHTNLCEYRCVEPALDHPRRGWFGITLFLYLSEVLWKKRWNRPAGKEVCGYPPQCRIISGICFWTNICFVWIKRTSVVVFFFGGGVPANPWQIQIVSRREFEYAARKLAYVYIYMNTYVHKYIHTTNIHTCMHAYTHTCIYTYTHAYIHAYTYIYIYIYICMCVCVCVCVCVYTYMYMYIFNIFNIFNVYIEASSTSLYMSLLHIPV
jgi:hypothetical protein